MVRETVSEQQLINFFNYAIANHQGLGEECRQTQVLKVERRERRKGGPNWTYYCAGEIPHNCKHRFEKIAREIGAVYDLE